MILRDPYDLTYFLWFYMALVIFIYLCIYDFTWFLSLYLNLMILLGL